MINPIEARQPENQRDQDAPGDDYVEQSDPGNWLFVVARVFVMGVHGEWSA